MCSWEVSEVSTESRPSQHAPVSSHTWRLKAKYQEQNEKKAKIKKKKKEDNNWVIIRGLAAKLQTPIVLAVFPIIIDLLSAAIEVYGSPINAMVKS